MKRTTLLLITAIYLLSCVGIGVNRFYCCGKLAAVTLIYGTADNGNNDTGKKDDCCKNEKQTFKVKDSHYNVVSFSLNQPNPAIILPYTFHHPETIVSLLHTNIVYKGNAPPGLVNIPFYTLNCTYRI